MDTAALVSILQESDPVSPTDLGAVLRAGGHDLVLSLSTVGELASPLDYARAPTNVMALLARLEDLPLVYVADACIHRLELDSALRAWRKSAEPAAIQPFRDRLDRAIPVAGLPATHQLVLLSLPEIVFMLWREDRAALWGYRDVSRRVHEVIRRDRLLLTKRPAPAAHYAQTVGRDLQLYRIGYEPDELGSFAAWIFEDGRRAPSHRLSHELYRQLVFNATDQLQDSDVVDLIHIYSAPYLDAFLLDGRMRTYLRQASRTVGLDFASKAAEGLHALLARLS